MRISYNDGDYKENETIMLNNDLRGYFGRIFAVEVKEQ